MAEDKWAEWNNKKPKDSKYDSGNWSKTEEDYARAEKAAKEEDEKNGKKSGFFANLKKSFGG